MNHQGAEGYLESCLTGPKVREFTEVLAADPK